MFKITMRCILVELNISTKRKSEYKFGIEQFGNTCKRAEAIKFLRFTHNVRLIPEWANQPIFDIKTLILLRISSMFFLAPTYTSNSHQFQFVLEVKTHSCSRITNHGQKFESLFYLQQASSIAIGEVQP